MYLLCDHSKIDNRSSISQYSKRYDNLDAIINNPVHFEKQILKLK